MLLKHLSWKGKIVKIYEMLVKNTFLVGLGKIFGRSVKNFGRPGQFLKVWKKIGNVREKISEIMYGKKSRGPKILATRGRGDFVKFYLAPAQNACCPLKCPPKFRDLAPPLVEMYIYRTKKYFVKLCKRYYMFNLLLMHFSCSSSSNLC